MTQPTPRRGRPSGARNIKTVVDVEPSRCTRCGSSKRTDYTNTTRRDFRNSGAPFVAIFYRRCKCLDCGQARVDRQPVYDPAPDAA